MFAYEINGTTQQVIADTHNEGVVPQILDEEGNNAYYIVTDGEDVPNEIVSNDDFADKYFDLVTHTIITNK